MAREKWEKSPFYMLFVGFQMRLWVCRRNYVAGTMDNVASAANNATSAMAAMGAAQQDLGKNTGYNSSIDTIITDTKKKATGGAGIGGIRQFVNRYAEGGVVKKNKKNPLNPLAESMGEDTMVAVKENEVILNEDQIKALKDYAVTSGGCEKDGNIYLTPLDNSAGQNMPKTSLRDSHLATQSLQQTNPESLTKQPEIEKTNVKNNNVTMHYDSLITVNGDVNDGDRIIKQMEKVATRAIEKSWHDCDLNRKYGIY